MFWVALLIVLALAFVAAVIGILVAIVGGKIIRNKAKRRQEQHRWNHPW